MIPNRDRFREFMEDNEEIDEYIFKMLLDGEWDGHAELVAFSKLYNVQIQIFDSFGSEKPIVRILIAEREKYDKFVVF